MIKNIVLLTKISTRNFLQNLNIFNKENRKINKKSMYYWLILVVVIAITYLSNEMLNLLKDYGQIDIFLEAVFTLIMIIMSMQIIISCMNILYFSKDIESFLMLPIKPKELLLSRIQTMLNISYLTESIFMLVPLILYGLKTSAGYSYYFAIPFIFLALPIFPVILVSIVFLVIIKFKKQIKNKNVFQSIVTLIFISAIILLEIVLVKNMLSNNAKYEQIGTGFDTILKYINTNMLVVNPLIDVLEQNNVLINILKIIGIYTVMYIILTLLGNKIYIKNILKTKEYIKPKIKKVLDLEKICKSQKITKSYIQNDFKNLFGNTTFFMQIIYPIFTTIIMIIILAISFRFGSMAKNEELYELIKSLNLTLEGACLIIGIAQVLFSFINISITAISRQGKNAIFMKYIPISLYKQTILKNVPQIIISTIISIILMLAIKIIFISILWIDLLCMLPVCIIVGILNSYLMLIVDIKRPIINWNTEIEVLKQNENKIFQYVWTIVIVLLLMYGYNVFENINIKIVMLILLIFFMVLLILLNIYVKKQIKKNKLFKKII